MKNTTRRNFLKQALNTSIAAAAGITLTGCQRSMEKSAARAAAQPNIVLVITDDQGYGDLRCHGNPYIKTPALDSFAKESVEFSRFYVCPVCAPTRAGLMTGRYNYRTGVVDTFIGRAMMYNEEVTLPEMLKKNGYTSALFGKWHLGDNYPLRPQDQGFDEVLMHNGGGIGQPSDPPGNTYFNTVFTHNGKQVKKHGYCMDVYTDAAVEFITANKNRPFFVYLATNTPHTPLEVPQRYVKPYLDMGLCDATARTYGMIENIDDNFRRLGTALEKLGLSENTIFIFLTDNGPTFWGAEKPRYSADLRGAKGSTFENGIRVPFFIRWPKGFKGSRKINEPAAHIDIMPTILDACGIAPPAKTKIDGLSLMPLIKASRRNLPERTLFFQWHRGDQPELYRAFAAIKGRYKLVQPNHPGMKDFNPQMAQFMLFDLAADPGEKNNIAHEHPDIVEQLKREYQQWFKEVSAERGFDPPRIYIGTQHENPVTLTRQDWRGTHHYEGPGVLGHWLVNVRHTGPYDITVRMAQPLETQAVVIFKCAAATLKQNFLPGYPQITFPGIKLQTGPAKLEAWLEYDGKKHGVWYVDLERKNN